MDQTLAPALSVIILLLRLSVFVFAILGVFYLARNWVRNDNRQKWAMITGMWVAVFASAALVLGMAAALDKQAVMQLVMLPVCVFLGVAIWLTSYAGMVLWDKNGGYWVRNNAGHQRSRSLLWCAVVAMALRAWTSVFLGLFAVPVLPAKWGPPLANLSYFCSQMAYTVAEEIFYRGWVLGILTVYLAKFRWGSAAALVVASIVFAVQHQNPLHPVLIMMNALAAGIVFGLVFRKFGLVAAIGVHMASNLLLALELPFVSR